ncbi:unnamed protein product [Nyctereutes procyonoides]|uniref:Nucleophosmin n=1 Tax=Nyctereutes procyonoides TaxID=34880 RepID=A0A811YSG2_NYCPR|nr:unnamed protein product [Nyctereutes procyonoides]CAD7688293.1 unnamed protein product [Nyctereutes procyonoides]
MHDSMDMDMSPLRPQNYLFVCELKTDKDYHSKVDNDENEHRLSLRTAMNDEGSPIKVTLATLKISVQPTVSLGGFEITPPVVLQLTIEEDVESEDEEEEDVKLLSISGKRSSPESGQESLKKQEKTPQAPKGPSSVEDIKANMQFINYVKNCIQMTDQEAIQDLWQWRKSL